MSSMIRNSSGALNFAGTRRYVAHILIVITLTSERCPVLFTTTLECYLQIIVTGHFKWFCATDGCCFVSVQHGYCNQSSPETRSSITWSSEIINRLLRNTFDMIQSRSVHMIRCSLLLFSQCSLTHNIPQVYKAGGQSKGAFDA